MRVRERAFGRGDGRRERARFAKSSIKCITRGCDTGHRDGVCLIYFDARWERRRTRHRPFLILSSLSPSHRDVLWLVTNSDGFEPHSFPPPHPPSSAFSTAPDSKLITVGHSSSLKVELELARFYSRILFTFDNCLTRFNPTGNNRNSVSACSVPNHERSLCNSWHVNGQRNFRICRLIISYKRADTKLISLVQFILLFVA